MFFPCTMRAAPTLIDKSAVDTFNLHMAGVFLVEPATLTATDQTTFGTLIGGTMTYTGTQGLAGQLCGDGTDHCYLGFSSEL